MFHKARPSLLVERVPYIADWFFGCYGLVLHISIATDFPMPVYPTKSSVVSQRTKIRLPSHRPQIVHYHDWKLSNLMSDAGKYTPIRFRLRGCVEETGSYMTSRLICGANSQLASNIFWNDFESSRPGAEAFNVRSKQGMIWYASRIFGDSKWKMYSFPVGVELINRTQSEENGESDLARILMATGACFVLSEWVDSATMTVCSASIRVCQSEIDVRLQSGCV